MRTRHAKVKSAFRDECREAFDVALATRAGMERITAATDPAIGIGFDVKTIAEINIGTGTLQSCANPLSATDEKVHDLRPAYGKSGKAVDFQTFRSFFLDPSDGCLRRRLDRSNRNADNDALLNRQL